MVGILKLKFAQLRGDAKFHEILFGSAVALIGRVAAVGFTLISSIIVARFYGANALGILAVVNAFLTLVTIFTVLGTGTSILRLISEHVAVYSATSAFLIYRKTQYFVAVFSVVTGTVFFLMSEIVAAKVFSKPHLSPYLALAACIVVFKSLMDLNTQAIRGLRLIRTFAVMQMLPSFTMVALLITLTQVFRHPFVPIGAQLTAFVVTAVAGVWIMNKTFANMKHPGEAIHPVPVAELLAVSLPMLMTASTQFFSAQTGVIMLGIFRSESDVGYYSVAVRLATLTVFVLQAINTMAAPKFAALYHTGNIDDLFLIARKSTKLIFWTTAPILLGLIVLGHPILSLFYGKDFTHAYPALVLLAIGQFVNSISGSTGHFMSMTGHQNVFSIISFLSALITILLGLILIPPFGIVGAAAVSMVSLALWNISILIFIKKKFGSTIGYLPLVRKMREKGKGHPSVAGRPAHQAVQVKPGAQGDRT